MTGCRSAGLAPARFSLATVRASAATAGDGDLRASNARVGAGQPPGLSGGPPLRPFRGGGASAPLDSAEHQWKDTVAQRATFRRLVSRYATLLSRCSVSHWCQDTAVLRDRLAYVYRRIGLRDSALAIRHRVLEDARSRLVAVRDQGNVDGLRLAFQTLGEAFRDLDQRDSALTAFQSSVTVAASRGHFRTCGEREPQAHSRGGRGARLPGRYRERRRRIVWEPRASAEGLRQRGSTAGFTLRLPLSSAQGSRRPRRRLEATGRLRRRSLAVLPRWTPPLMRVADSTRSIGSA